MLWAICCILYHRTLAFDSHCYSRLELLRERSLFYSDLLGFSRNSRTMTKWLYDIAKPKTRDRTSCDSSRGQGLSPESVACQHLSRPKGNPLPSDEFIGNLRRETGDAKDLLFRLNLTACARGQRVKLCGKVGATFNARAIKVEDVRNQQRMFSYGFLVRLNLKSSVNCATRDGAAGMGKTPAKWTLRRFIFIPYTAINAAFFL